MVGLNLLVFGILALTGTPCSSVAGSSTLLSQVTENITILSLSLVWSEFLIVSHGRLLLSKHVPEHTASVILLLIRHHEGEACAVSYRGQMILALLLHWKHYSMEIKNIYKV